MDNVGFHSYSDLENSDRDAPRRYYTVDTVQRRKNKILTILMPLLEAPPGPLTRLECARELAHLLVPKKSKKKAEPASFFPVVKGVDTRETLLEKAIFDSFRYPINEVPTLECLRKLAWRLAGNTHKLEAGDLALPWAPDRQPVEWCLARVMEVVDTETYDKEPGFKLTLFFYSGLPAGLEFSRVYPAGHEARFAENFGIPWKKSRLLFPVELTSMIGYVKLCESQGKSKVPMFRAIMASGSHIQHNRQLHEDRQDYDKCPYGYKPDPLRSCLECPLAYEESAEADVRLVCRLAVRRRVDASWNAVEAAGGNEVVRAGEGHHGVDPVPDTGGAGELGRP